MRCDARERTSELNHRGSLEATAVLPALYRPDCRDIVDGQQIKECSVRWTPLILLTSSPASAEALARC